MRAILSAIVRGAKLRCPRCGKGKLFAEFGLLVERCSSCKLPIQAREFNTWFFMYVSTAALTGVFIIGMLLITPKNIWLGRLLIITGSIAVFFGTQSARKGIAIALDYILDRFTGEK